jgi:hypothetical protein
MRLARPSHGICQRGCTLHSASFSKQQPVLSYIGQSIALRGYISAGVERQSVDVRWVQARVRQRVLRWFVRQGYLDKDDAKDMAEWSNGGGFSVDASVQIEADDRAGLERLLRYCARPPFALERLEAIDAYRLIYRLIKPQQTGQDVAWGVRNLRSKLFV